MHLPSDNRANAGNQDLFASRHEDGHSTSRRNIFSGTNQGDARLVFSPGASVEAGIRGGGNPETSLNLSGLDKFVYMRAVARERPDWKTCLPTREEAHPASKETFRRQSNLAAGACRPKAGPGQALRLESESNFTRRVYEPSRGGSNPTLKVCKTTVQKRSGITSTSELRNPQTFLFRQSALVRAMIQTGLAFDLSKSRQESFECLESPSELEDRASYRSQFGNGVYCGVGWRIGLFELGSSLQYRHNGHEEHFQTAGWFRGEAPTLRRGAQHINERYFGCNLFVLNYYREWREQFCVEHKISFSEPKDVLSLSSLKDLVAGQKEQGATGVDLRLDIRHLQTRGLTVQLPAGPGPREYRLAYKKSQTQNSTIAPSGLDFAFTNCRNTFFESRQDFGSLVTLSGVPTDPISLEEKYSNDRQYSSTLGSGLRVLVEAEVKKECFKVESSVTQENKLLRITPKNLNLLTITTTVWQPMIPCAESHQDQLNIVQSLVPLRLRESREGPQRQSAPGRCYKVVISPTKSQRNRLFALLENKAVYAGAVRSVSLDSGLLTKLAKNLAEARGNEEKMASLLAVFCHDGGVEAVKLIQALVGDDMVTKVDLNDCAAHRLLNARGEVAILRQRTRPSTYRQRIEGIPAGRWLAQHNTELSQVVDSSRRRLEDSWLKLFAENARAEKKISTQVNTDKLLKQLKKAVAEIAQDRRLMALMDRQISACDEPSWFIASEDLLNAVIFENITDLIAQRTSRLSAENRSALVRGKSFLENFIRWLAEASENQKLVAAIEARVQSLEFLVPPQELAQKIKTVAIERCAIFLQEEVHVGASASALAEAEYFHEMLMKCIEDAEKNCDLVALVEGQLSDLHLSETPLAPKELLTAMVLQKSTDLVSVAFANEKDGARKLHLYAYGEQVLRDVAEECDFGTLLKLRAESTDLENEASWNDQISTHNAYLGMSLAKAGRTLPKPTDVLRARNNLREETLRAFENKEISLSDVVSFVVQNIWHWVALGASWEVIITYLRMRLPSWVDLNSIKHNLFAA